MTKFINTVFVKETASTNELAKEFLKKRERSLPFAVQAAFQTNGKGQYSKVWESNAEENLLFSLVLKAPIISIEEQFNISKAVAVAIRQVVSNFTERVCIKWPNDIYVGDKKIAGVLIENTIIGSKLDTCIIGIGLNVNQIQFSPDLPNPISIKQLTSLEQDIELIKNQIVDEISLKINNLEGASLEYDKFLYRKGELGEFLTAENPVFFGVILGVNRQGKLCIRTENNETQTFSNNEVQFVLPKTN